MARRIPAGRKRAVPRARTRTLWRRLATEARNPRSARLDVLPVEDVVRLVLDEDRRALAAALRERAAIARLARLAARTLAAGGRLLLAGAGTSGRLGVLEAAECPPTFGSDPRRIRAFMAGGDGAVFRAIEGAEDEEGDGRRCGEEATPRDLLVGISASAVTPFVRGALAEAGARGARTALVTCAAAWGTKRLADLVVCVGTGPEVLTGSTRLKAGSATKAVLNAVTTAAMVQLGKAYGNLMVDVRPGSAKLRDRARRIVMEAAAVGSNEAERLLQESGGEAKTAIVMARLGLPAAESRRRLAEAGGQVRATLARRRAPAQSRAAAAGSRKTRTSG